MRDRNTKRKANNQRLWGTKGAYSRGVERQHDVATNPMARLCAGQRERLAELPTTPKVAMGWDLYHFITWARMLPNYNLCLENKHLEWVIDHRTYSIARGLHPYEGSQRLRTEDFWFIPMEVIDRLPMDCEQLRSLVTGLVPCIRLPRIEENL